MLKSSLIFDEFPTIYFNNMDSLIATARSNKVATTLAMQDFSQLKKDYGKELADVIVNIAGNIISGQVMGETAKLLSERFGKIMQDRQAFLSTELILLSVIPNNWKAPFRHPGLQHYLRVNLLVWKQITRIKNKTKNVSCRNYQRCCKTYKSGQELQRHSYCLCS